VIDSRCSVPRKTTRVAPRRENSAIRLIERRTGRRVTITTRRPAERQLGLQGCSRTNMDETRDDLNGMQALERGELFHDRPYRTGLGVEPYTR